MGDHQGRKTWEKKMDVKNGSPQGTTLTIVMILHLFIIFYTDIALSTGALETE